MLLAFAQVRKLTHKNNTDLFSLPHKMPVDCHRSIVIMSELNCSTNLCQNVGIEGILLIAVTVPTEIAANGEKCRESCVIRIC